MRALAVPLAEPLTPMRSSFVFEGRVVGAPSFQRDGQILTIEVMRPDGSSRAAMRVRIPLGQSYYSGETVAGRCSSAKPESIDRNFFEKPVSAQMPFCSYAIITGHRTDTISFRGNLARVRDFFGEAIRAGLPAPESDLLSGLLVGAHGAFSQELARSFRSSGLSHIVVISGSNISLVIAGLWSVSARSRTDRKKRFWVILAVLMLFVLLTGASASTIRAGIMGMMALLAQYLGRLARSGHALIAAAAVMVAVDPTILLFNVGFQLSFLATLGLIVCAPYLATRFSQIPASGGLRDVCAQTVSALLFTAPLLIATFQTFSVVGFFANVLVVPLIPTIMTLGFGWSILASMSFALGGVLSFSLQPLVAVLGLPLYGFLSYVVHIANGFASLPFAVLSWDIGAWTPLFLIVSYAVLAWAVYRLRAHQKTILV
jgi:competence protein ComEC